MKSTKKTIAKSYLFDSSGYGLFLIYLILSSDFTSFPFPGYLLALQEHLL